MSTFYLPIKACTSCCSSNFLFCCFREYYDNVICSNQPFLVNYQPSSSSNCHNPHEAWHQWQFKSSNMICKVVYILAAVPSTTELGYFVCIFHINNHLLSAILKSLFLHRPENHFSKIGFQSLWNLQWNQLCYWKKMHISHLHFRHLTKKYRKPNLKHNFELI